MIHTKARSLFILDYCSATFIVDAHVTRHMMDFKMMLFLYSIFAIPYDCFAAKQLARLRHLLAELSYAAPIILPPNICGVKILSFAAGDTQGSFISLPGLASRCITAPQACQPAMRLGENGGRFLRRHYRFMRGFFLARVSPSAADAACGRHLFGHFASARRCHSTSATPSQMPPLPTYDVTVPQAQNESEHHGAA